MLAWRNGFTHVVAQPRYRQEPFYNLSCYHFYHVITFTNKQKNNRKRNEKTFSGFEHCHPNFQCKWLSTKQVCKTRACNNKSRSRIVVHAKISRWVVHANYMWVEDSYMQLKVEESNKDTCNIKSRSRTCNNTCKSRSRSCNNTCSSSSCTYNITCISKSPSCSNKL